MRKTVGALLLAFSLSAHAELKELVKVDDHIYRGKQPRWDDYPILAHMGIKTVLDLRGGRIHKPRERRHAEASGLQYISIRLSGVWEPHDYQVAQVLSVLENPANWPIYIHCWRGFDRIGLVLACYHIHHDHWTNQRALDDARELGLNRWEFLLQRYIRNYTPPNQTAHPAVSQSGAARSTSEAHAMR